MTKGRNDGAGWAAARLRPPPLGGGGLANSKHPPETRHQGRRPDVGRGNGASFRSLYSMAGPTDTGRAGSSDASETGYLEISSSEFLPQAPPPFARNIVPETPVQPDPYRFTIYNVTMSPLSTSRRSATGRNAFLLFSSSEFRGPTMLHSSARDGLVAGNGLRQ